MTCNPVCLPATAKPTGNSLSEMYSVKEKGIQLENCNMSVFCRWKKDDQQIILGNTPFVQCFIIMTMLSKLINQGTVSRNLVAGGCAVREVVKDIVMDPCVQLFISPASDEAPKGQNTTSNLFTPSQTHIIHTLRGLTSLR